MPEISPQTKSFFVLFALAFFSVGFALILSLDLSTRSDYLEQEPNFATPIDQTATNPQPEVLGADIMPKVENVDTSNWKTYTDEEYGFSFKYEPDWKILPTVKKSGYTILQIDPGKKYYNFKIYINPDQFYIMDGLPARTESIGGAAAINVKNSLYGVTSPKIHLTFDIGWSMQLLSEFNALVRSVRFN